MDADKPRVEELLRQLAEKEVQLIELPMSMQAMEALVGAHRELETDLNPLPIPRLELRCSPADDAIEWRYSLVYRHFLDHIQFVPLGITLVSGADAVETLQGGKLRLPMRDGAHIHHDMQELRLPAFAICGEIIEQLEPRS